MIDRICQFEDTHPRAFVALSFVVALPIAVGVVYGLLVMFAAAIAV